MKRARGFSLVELMVGLVISLIVALVAYAVLKGSAQAARRVVDNESAWHGAKLALLSMGKNLQEAGYLIDLTAPGAVAPIAAAAQNATAYTAPSGFPSLQISTITNTSGIPGVNTLSNSVWDIYISPTTANPALRQTVTPGGTVTEYADGIVAMRFQFTCASATAQYYTPACPGGVSDAKSVQIAMLSRGILPDPAGKVVALPAYTFPDGSIYTVPSTGGQGCVGGNCTLYRHQLFVTEVPLRNLYWGL